MTFSYNDSALLEQILLTAYENGNRDEGKPFNPSPEEWKCIGNWLNDIDHSRKEFERMYGGMK